MSNDELTSHVTDELFWDPKVDNAAIAVSTADGVVTLRGTVGSLRQKREAKKDAERVWGVKNVNNDLQVRLLNDDRREDADLRGAVLQALGLDSLVPATVGADVDVGMVTLKARPTGSSSATRPRRWRRTSPAWSRSKTPSSSFHQVQALRTSSTRSRKRWNGTRSWTRTASQSRARTEP